MQTQEHAQTALEFLAKADTHFVEGDQLQASEKLWGAAVHVVTAVALERGWPHTCHPALKRAAERLTAEHNDPLIAAGFGVAEKYHIDVCYPFMEAEEWKIDRPKVRDFVARAVALLEGYGLGSKLQLGESIKGDTPMETQEHAQTALEFLAKADTHFVEGDQLQASEKLWGAAAHAVLAVAIERGWPHTSHPALKRAAERLAVEHNDPQIADRFVAAEQYHCDFYHRFLEAEEWQTDRPKVRDFVARVLALRGGDASLGRNGQPATD